QPCLAPRILFSLRKKLSVTSSWNLNSSPVTSTQEYSFEARASPTIKTGACMDTSLRSILQNGRGLEEYMMRPEGCGCIRWSTILLQKRHSRLGNGTR